MSNLISFLNPVDLSDHTLIIPSVSVGNVPQLTVDLIISTYNLKKVATLWHPGIIPSVGGDPFDEQCTQLCTACELYTHDDMKLSVIQIRSSIDGKYATKFYEALRSSIVELKFKNVIVLASSFAHEMHDVTSSKFRYLASAASEQSFTLAKLQIPKFEEENEDFVIHGAGFAERLYTLLRGSIGTLLVVKYCSEGDNRPDALEMLNLLHKIIDNFNADKVEVIKYPVSWNHIFGNPIPHGMF